jgi:hypothetical protein
MNLAFGRCRVPSFYSTSLAGLLASMLSRLLAAGLADILRCASSQMLFSRSLSLYLYLIVYTSIHHSFHIFIAMGQTAKVCY